MPKLLTSMIWRIASTGLVALLLAAIPVSSVRADHDIREVWTKYQETCQNLEAMEARQAALNATFKEQAQLYESLNCSKYKNIEENRACYRIRGEMTRAYREFQANFTYVKILKEECKTQAGIFRTALTHALTEIVLTGPPPDKTKQTTKSPGSSQRSRHSRTSSARKRRQPPSRTTRRPQRGHTTQQTRAAAAITGIIIYGVGQAISRGGSRGGSGGGSRGGGGGGGGRGAPIP